MGQWDRFEAALTNAKRYRNPYNDVTLDVTYTRPDATTVDFWGFYDGSATWKIRFMPDQIGAWKYEARFSDGSPGAAGTFRCAASTIPGMLAKDEANPRWFGYKGGKHVLVRSFHVGHNFLSYSWDDPGKDGDGNKRKTFLDWAQKQGYNTLSIHSHYNGESSQRLWPLDAAQYREAEAILDELARRRILVYPFYGFFGNRGNPSDPADQKRYIRYTLARFGPYWNLLLNVAGPEPNLRGWMSPEAIHRVGNEIKTRDVFGHPLGVHNKDGDDPYRSAPWSSFLTLQVEITDLNELNRYFLKNHTGDKPVFAQETLWPGNKLQPFANADAATVRKHAWTHMLSAVALNNGDMNGNNDSGFSGSLDLADRIPWRHDVVKQVWDFFEALPFYRMNPSQSLVDNGFCLAEPGQRYLVYLPTGGTVNVKVPGGTYHVEWINAQNTSDRRGAGTTSNGQDLSSPSGGDDWLVHLVRSRAAVTLKGK